MTMFYIGLALSGFSFIFCAFSLWAIIRVNKYASQLEDDIDYYIDRCDNLEESIRTALKEDMLDNEGKMQKPLLSREEYS